MPTAKSKTRLGPKPPHAGKTSATAALSGHLSRIGKNLCALLGHKYHLIDARTTGYRAHDPAPQRIMLRGIWECTRCGAVKKRAILRRIKAKMN